VVEVVRILLEDPEVEDHHLDVREEDNKS